MFCQFCLDRQIEEPQEAIGLYQKRPICDPCLGVIMDNDSNTQVIDTGTTYTDLKNRKERALKLLDKFEELFESWELFEDEVLLSRDDFFNHRPPAIINMSIAEIKKRVSFRKAILFTFRIKDERWTSLIEDIRNEERKREGLLRATKPGKKIQPASKAGKEQKAKLAKSLGITVEQLELLGTEARKEEFGGIIARHSSEPKIEAPKKEPSETKKSLTELKDQILKTQTQGLGVQKVVRCQVCKKLTCICKVR